MEILTVLAAVSLAVWLYLVFLHGGFWRADQRLDASPAYDGDWSGVVMVVPARNEAPVIGRTVAALLAQDYPGDIALIMVDDRSGDGTTDAAQAAAEGDDRLHILGGEPLPAGWAGKMWALSQGVARACEILPEARYFLFTDADIDHDPGVLRALVAKAENERLDQVSLMAWLRCETAWERLLIPAFVFFFQKLYPFPWVNDPRRKLAAAAGGCVLLRRHALDRAGGIAAIKGALIDDCALARMIKPGGAIWLGLTTMTRSHRPYVGLRDIWNMVARSAYTQLHHSPWLLVGTVGGMVVIYLAPPAALIWGVVTGHGGLIALGVAAWLIMAGAYGPTLALYNRPRIAAVLLPVSGFLYTLMTVDSAVRHWRGRGGEWKGRVQATN
jgi:hopene-associated glycosyltransferase HpnB